MNAGDDTVSSFHWVCRQARGKQPADLHIVEITRRSEPSQRDGA
jgi:hypothetical protein